MYQENPDPVLYDRDSIQYLLNRFPNEIIGLKLRMGKSFSDGLGLALLLRQKIFPARLAVLFVCTCGNLLSLHTKML
jgi:predicted amidohydrolase